MALARNYPMCENAKVGEAWRTYFSHHAVLELSMLSVISEAATKGMPFSGI
jgi:hypothetical protein